MYPYSSLLAAGSVFLSLSWLAAALESFWTASGLGDLTEEGGASGAAILYAMDPSVIWRVNVNKGLSGEQ